MCPSGKESLWGTTSEVVYDPDTPKTRSDEIQKLLLGAEELFPNIRNYKSFGDMWLSNIINKPRHYNKLSEQACPI